MAQGNENQVTVGATYAGARENFKQDYARDVGLAEVKSAVLEQFGLAETVDAAGNQTVYSLYKGNDPVEMSFTVGDVAGEHKHLQFRLVRQVVAG